MVKILKRGIKVFAKTWDGKGGEKGKANRDLQEMEKEEMGKNIVRILNIQ